MHVVLRDITLDFVQISWCKNLKLENLIIKREMVIYGSKNLELNNCEINYLSLRSSYHNLVKDSTFLGFDNPHSRANTFVNCQFYKKFEKLIMEGDPSVKILAKEGVKFLIPLCLMGIILAFVFGYNFPFQFWFLISLSVAGFLMGLYMWRRGKKGENYPPNVIK